MHLDLFEAKPSIGWPSSQLLYFHARLEEWLAANVHVEIRDLPPPATHNPIVAVERELLPLTFSVEAGAYINAIRSSLDVLAMALVRRHGLAIPVRPVHPRLSSPIRVVRKSSTYLSYSILGCPGVPHRSQKYRFLAALVAQAK
jgi:hypothetical protein